MGLSPHLPPQSNCSEPPPSNSVPSIITSSMQVIYNVDEPLSRDATRDYTDYATSDEEGMQWDRARAVHAWCFLHVQLINRNEQLWYKLRWVDIDINLGLIFQTKRDRLWWPQVTWCTRFTLRVFDFLRGTLKYKVECFGVKSRFLNLDFSLTVELKPGHLDLDGHVTYFTLILASICSAIIGYISRCLESLLTTIFEVFATLALEINCWKLIRPNHCIPLPNQHFLTSS